MEQMSDKQLDQRIDSFVKRKAEQFPMLAEDASGGRENSLSLLSRLSAGAHQLPRFHRPRHLSI